MAFSESSKEGVGQGKLGQVLRNIVLIFVRLEAIYIASRLRDSYVLMRKHTHCFPSSLLRL